eukprot:9039441-Pyramimonas_sp.AAC.1
MAWTTAPSWGEASTSFPAPWRWGTRPGAALTVSPFWRPALPCGDFGACFVVRCRGASGCLVSAKPMSAVLVLCKGRAFAPGVLRVCVGGQLLRLSLAARST